MVCDSPRELAEVADVVITMLADDGASEQVHHGADGIFATSDGATHVIEIGTHSPRHVRQLGAQAGGGS